MKKINIAILMVFMALNTEAQVPVYGSFKVEHAPSSPYNPSTLLDKYDTPKSSPKSSNDTYPDYYYQHQVESRNNIPYISLLEIQNFIHELNLGVESFDVWIKTSLEGTRFIHFQNTEFEGLPNDEYALGLRTSKLIFEYLLGGINYNRKIPISASTFIQILSRDYYMNSFSFKTKNRVHYYNLNKILLELTN